MTTKMDNVILQHVNLRLQVAQIHDAKYHYTHIHYYYVTHDVEPKKPTYLYEQC